MALEKVDKDLFKRFIDIVMDLDEEGNFKGKLEKVKKLSEDCEKRRAELEARRKMADKELFGDEQCCWSKPCEGIKVDVADVFAEFVLIHQDGLTRTVDLWGNQRFNFAWEDDTVHLSYEDIDEKTSGWCSILRPSKKDIKERLLDMFGTDDDEDE